MIPARQHVVSSFTLIKGSLLGETYAVFAGWDLGASKDENLDRLRATNWIGATSANWLRDVAKVLHRRFDTEGRDRPLVVLAQRGCPLSVWTPLLLWHATRDEFLLRDFLEDWLFERYEGGAFRLRTEDLLPYLQALFGREEAVTGEESWSESTTKRVASALLKFAADVGLLTGTLAREFTTYHLPDASLLYLLHAIEGKEHNAQRVVEAPDWRMYLMEPGDIERELLRLHQYRQLEYHVAGSLAQLTLPASDTLAFAEVMTW